MRRCSVCSHAARSTIDADLEAGASARSLAMTHGLGTDAVQRHARNHRARDPIPVDPEIPPSAPPLDELVEALRARALAGDPAVVREYRLALTAQEVARASAAPPLDLSATPEWHLLRGRILDALHPYPEARMAVADALGVH